MTTLEDLVEKRDQRRRRRRRQPEPDLDHIVLDVMDAGYGDAIVATWLAEETKGKVPDLTIYCRGRQKELIGLLGQKAAISKPTDHVSRTFSYERSKRGHPVRLVAWATVFGLPVKWKRPTHTLIQGELDAAQQFDVLLYAFASDRRREWPEVYYDELEEALKADGLTVCRPRSRGSWRSTAALMLASRLVVGGDSSPAHLAGTLDIPTIVITGPTTESIFAHMASVHCLRVEQRILRCAGCWYNAVDGYDKFCSLGCLAMSHITPAQVLAKARERLNDTAP